MIFSPSLLSSDFGKLTEEIHVLQEANIPWVHWDVMDGTFVPNITYGPPVIKALRAKSTLFFDVHLMIIEPERHLNAFAEAGANMLTVHAEATRHLDRTLREIRRLGMKAGVAINPATSVQVLENVTDLFDMALIMSVNPGFGGQKFIPRSYVKIRQLADLLMTQNSPALIQVDGGVDLGNISELITAGADVLVSGSAFFQFPPYKERYEAFIEEAKTASPIVRPDLAGHLASLRSL